jgi:hypothetical protein
VDKHRGEEYDRRIEVEYGRHCGDEAEQRKEEAAGAQPCPGEPCPKCLEQPVGGGYHADKEQAGDQYKRWPGLPSLTDRGSHHHDRT